MPQPIKKRIFAALLVAGCAFSGTVETLAHASDLHRAPILQALNILTPSNYRVDVDQNIPTSTILKWGESGNWESRLRSAAESAGLSARVDTFRHLITVSGGFGETRISRVSLSGEPSTSRGDFGLRSAWDQMAPRMPDRPVRLIDAVESLVPSWQDASGKSIGLEILATDLSTPVRWLDGQSRWSALQSMLYPLGLRARMHGMTLRIAPASMGSGSSSFGDDSGDGFDRHDQGDVRDDNRNSFRNDERGDWSRASRWVQSAPAAPVDPTSFEMIAGQSVRTNLERWAKEAGWNLVWSVNKDWIVPASSTFPGKFEAAASDAVRALSENGAHVFARFYLQNRTLVVSAAQEPM